MTVFSPFRESFGSILTFCQYVVACLLAYKRYVWCQIKALSWVGKSHEAKKKKIFTKSEEELLDTAAKLVVITGTDRGFGRELTELLYRTTDFKVLALSLTDKAAMELNSLAGSEKNQQLPDLTSSKIRLVAMKCDVTSDEDVNRMERYVGQNLSRKDDTGRKKLILYTLVNNAGVVDPGDFIWYHDLSKHVNVMNVNFFGMLRVTKALLLHMVRTSRSIPKQHQRRTITPRIINMSSVCGASSSAGNSAYNASKFAIEGWSDSLRLELQPFNINVIKLRPGQIATDIQMDYVVRFQKNFEDAQDEVRKLYGQDKYTQKIKHVFTAAAAATAGPMPTAKHVAEKLKEIILLPSPQPLYWIGKDAQTTWRAWHTLPIAVSDLAKIESLTIGPVME